MCALVLPVRTFGQQLWDGGGNDLEWTNGANWTCSLGGACDNRAPNSTDSACNFYSASPTTQTNIYLSADTTVTRIQLRNNCAGPPNFRTISIGTNNTTDVTLGLNGAQVGFLNNQKGVGGWDLGLSGAPNSYGAKMKLRIDVTQPIDVTHVDGTITVSCDIFGNAGFSKTGAGKLLLSGTCSYLGNTTVSGGTLLINSPGSLPAGSAVSVASGATVGGSGTIGGTVTVSSGGTVSPGASVGTLTIGGDLTLSGNMFVQLDKSLTPSNDVVSVTGVLTNAGAGTVTVVNIGNIGLVPGDSFQLFNKPMPNGEALTIVSPLGVVWTNRLADNGTIEVLSVPPVAAATNLTIAATGPTSVSLGALGVANRPYNVHASTNVALPMSSWWLIGITNSDGSGVIQFLDSQATNDQRYYRFGQTVP